MYHQGEPPFGLQSLDTIFYSHEKTFSLCIYAQGNKQHFYFIEENFWVDPGLKLITTMCIYKSNVHPIQIQDI